MTFGKISLMVTLITLITTIGMAPTGSADITPGLFAYVTNSGSDTVSVIELDTNTVVDTVYVGDSPRAVAVTPDGRFVYVIEYWDTVYVIDTNTNTVVDTIEVAGVSGGIAITPDGRFAYAVDNYGNKIRVIDTSTNIVVDTAESGDTHTNPREIAITPDGSFAYVTNGGEVGGFSYTVGVIDLSTNTLATTIEIWRDNQGVAITPDGLYACVTNTKTYKLHMISTSTNSIVATATIGDYCWGHWIAGTEPGNLVITPDSSYAYVTRADGQVFVVNLANPPVIEEPCWFIGGIPVGGGPTGIAITPDGSFVYVANKNSDTISVIDTSTNTVVDTISGFDSPYGIAISSSGEPTLVGLSMLTATATAEGVIIRWRTETELDNVGFAIYRSTIRNGSYAKIGFVYASEDSETSNEYQFTDKGVEAGKTYFYYLEDIDVAGKKSKSEIIKVVVPQAKSVRLIPSTSALLQNYPNPFNPETCLPYQLASDSPITISIYNTKGQLIHSISLGNKDAGVYVTKDKAAYWDGRNQIGKPVASGVYFYTLQAGKFTATRRMVIVK